MGKKTCLNDADRSMITSLFGNGATTLEISEIMGREHRSIKIFVFSEKNEDKKPARSHLKK